MSTILRLALAALALAACAPKPSTSAPVVAAAAVPLTELTVSRVAADLETPDPDALYWSSIQAGAFPLMAQPMITPHPETTTTEAIEVQAVHDGTRIAFRLRWKDTERSLAGRLGEFSDAVALEFPIALEPLPPPMMGAAGMPVHIFHWRAQYQEDAEHGKPDVHDLYPNASVDMYAMDFHEAEGGSKEDREQFSPGVAVGNPQSNPKSGVDEIIAEGFSTSAVQEGHGSKAMGVWKDGWWTVVISRPLAIPGGSTIAVGGSIYVSYAVWQGGLNEVGSRKCIQMSWTPVKVQG